METASFLLSLLHLVLRLGSAHPPSCFLSNPSDFFKVIRRLIQSSFIWSVQSSSSLQGQLCLCFLSLSWSRASSSCGEASRVFVFASNDLLQIKLGDGQLGLLVSSLSPVRSSNRMLRHLRQQCLIFFLHFGKHLFLQRVGTSYRRTPTRHPAAVLQGVFSGWCSRKTSASAGQALKS